MVYLNAGEHVSNADITTNSASGFKVSGIVTDAEGNPIPNGLISLGMKSTVTMTDNAGRFATWVLNGGWYGAAAGVPGYHAIAPPPVTGINSPQQGPSTEGRIEINSNRDDIHIVLKKNTISLSGKVVVADTGEPIPNFEIYAFPAHRPSPGNPEQWQGAQRIYSKDGSYRLENTTLDPGPCTVFVVAPGRGVGSLELTIPSDATEVDANISVPQHPSVSGLVVDHLGNPVQGVDIFTSYFPLEMRVATSSIDGSFKADGLNIYETSLIAYHPSYLPITLGIPRNKSDSKLRFQFPPSGSIAVRVTQNGKPATMATVSLKRDLGPISSFSAIGLHSKMTDQEGIAVFKGAPVGESIVTASVTGRWGEGVSTSQSVNVFANKTADLLFDFAGGTANIQGTFLYNGKPLNQGSVSYRIDAGGDELDLSRTASQADGSWEISDVPSGVGTLRFLTYTDGGSIERLVSVELAEGEVKVVDVDEGVPTDAEEYASLHGVALIEGIPSLYTAVAYEVVIDDTTLRYTTSSQTPADGWQFPPVLSGTGVITVTAHDSEGKEYEQVQELTLAPSESKSLEINLTGDSLVARQNEQ